MLSVAHRLFLHLKLTVQEDFLLFVLDHEARLTDSISVCISGALLVVRILLVSLLICGLGVGLAIEDHLLPRLEPLKDVEDVFVLRVVGLAWAHERSIL